MNNVNSFSSLWNFNILNLKCSFRMGNAVSKLHCVHFSIFRLLLFEMLWTDGHCPYLSPDSSGGQTLHHPHLQHHPKVFWFLKWKKYPSIFTPKCVVRGQPNATFSIRREKSEYIKCENSICLGPHQVNLWRTNGTWEKRKKLPQHGVESTCQS